MHERHGNRRVARSPAAESEPSSWINSWSIRCVGYSRGVKYAKYAKARLRTSRRVSGLRVREDHTLRSLAKSVLHELSGSKRLLLPHRIFSAAMRVLNREHGVTSRCGARGMMN